MAERNQGLASALGLPNKSDMLLEKGRADDVDGQMNTVDAQKEPIQVSEGEFIWSVPAIMGLGGGDYEEGLMMLEELHNEMYSIGNTLIEQQGLGAVE